MTNFSNFISAQLKDSSCQQETPKKHKIACKNCARLHHKCDKMYPSCSHCLKKGVKCEVNPSIKKRGRPFGTTKDILEQKKQNKRNVNTTTNNTQELPETKRVKILSQPREIPFNTIPSSINNTTTFINNNNLMFFQVPIDINWDFSFQQQDNQQNGVNMNNIMPQQQQQKIDTCQKIDSHQNSFVSNHDVYGIQDVTCIQSQQSFNNTYSQTTQTQFFQPCSDFSVSSPPSEESISSDDFVLDVENFDFDNFNSFLDQEFQFC